MWIVFLVHLWTVFLSRGPVAIIRTRSPMVVFDTRYAALQQTRSLLGINAQFSHLLDIKTHTNQYSYVRVGVPAQSMDENTRRPPYYRKIEAKKP